MVSVNPFAEFRIGCENALKDALNRLFAGISVPSILLESPPSPEFGELSSSICFELAKQTKEKPLKMAERIVEAVDMSFPLVNSVKAAGKGYVNFYVNFEELCTLTIESARTLNSEYGYAKTCEPRKIIVEHTSANPIHPITIGHARNTMLGDVLARILEAHGHTVFRHYYVDDVGRQGAVIAYGYKKICKPKSEGKPDGFIGAIYALTSCLIAIQRIKKEIEKAKEFSTSEEVSRLQRELDDWVAAAADLESRFPVLFGRLLDEISKDEDPESQVRNLIRRYEAGLEESKLLIREVCQLCLNGFKDTLDKAGVSIDSWDWESDFIWSGEVIRALEKLKKTPYVFQSGGILEFDAEKVAQDFDLKKTLGLREDYEVPSLTLVRADGTTLYTTRDIPYHIWKFKKAESVINVIGMEQTLSQMQLKLALSALGHLDQAKNLVHFAYNLVSLQGSKMSSRRGRYITLDEVLDGAIERAYEEVSKRSPHLPEEEKRCISNFVGVGAVKYALVEVDPTKPVLFSWDRVLDFDKNSAPYIQYTHARANSILRKAAREPENPKYSLLTDRSEYDITLMLARFPEVFLDVAENLKPSSMADFANALADKFNTFYNSLPVIRAEQRGLSDARLALVDATRIVLRNALSLLGIEAPERM